MIDMRTDVCCVHFGSVVMDSSGNSDGVMWPAAFATATCMFNPLFSTGGTSSLGVGADPADATRFVGHVDNNATASRYDARYYVLNGTNEPGSAAESAAEFWSEVTFEFAFTGAYSATADIITFFEIMDKDDDNIRVQIRGGGSPVWRVINNTGGILDALNNLISSATPLAAGTKYAFRFHWTAESTPGAGDGTLQFVTVNLDAGTVLHNTTITSCQNNKFASLKFYSGTQGTNVLTSDFYWDHWTYSATSAPGSMTATTSWAAYYRVPGPMLGAMKTDTDTTKIAMRVGGLWVDGDLGNRTTATTADAVIQYRVSGAGSWTDSATTHDCQTETTMGFFAETLTGLEPLTTYEFRTKFTRDAVVTYSQVTSCTTLSASGGSGGVLKFGCWSCTSPSKQPGYPQQYLGQVSGAHEIACLGDYAYFNTAMGYNTGTSYLAYGTATVRRLEWHRLMLTQLLSPQHARGCYGSSAMVLFTDDHEFRDDLAGQYTPNLSGDNLAMLQEIGTFVKESMHLFSYAKDTTNTARKYWWTRDTAKTITLNLECRQYADHQQNRNPNLPTDSSASPWNGQVNAGAGTLVREDTSTWGTTVLGSEQAADMIAAIEATTKPIVLIRTPVLISNGGHREYQDVGTYPEIWDILQACEDNSSVKAVIVQSGDLHHAMVVDGANVPSAARMTALSKAASYPKLLWEAMIGGGGQGGHRSRWSIGNTTDADSGLRGGTWSGASSPRWTWLEDFNHAWPGDETCDCWDYDLSAAVTWDGDGTSGIGNMAKQERCQLVTINESLVNPTITLSVIDLYDKAEVYSREDTVVVASASGVPRGSSLLIGTAITP